MILRERETLSKEYLAGASEIALYHVYHHVISSILYPPCCSCRSTCNCADFRSKIVLTLNTAFYAKAEAERSNPKHLKAIRLIMEIPEAHEFQKIYSDAYPLWLIQDTLSKKMQEGCFEAVRRMVFALLSLVEKRRANLEMPQASLNHAITAVLEAFPKRHERYICGEKGYAQHLNQYKSVCHFVAAFTHLYKDQSLLSLQCPKKIEKFLQLSQWLREKLLQVETPKIKRKSLFFDDMLVPLPAWIKQSTFNVDFDLINERL